MQNTLQLAVEHYQREILLLLLEYGANPNVDSTKSPLIYACTNGGTNAMEMIAILRVFGAKCEEAVVQNFIEEHEEELAGKSNKSINVK